MPQPDETALARAYREAAYGADRPPFLWIECEECNTTFVVVSGDMSSVCVHLQEALCR